MTAPQLVFVWGNPSRGDDALGPLFGDAIAARALPGVEVLSDFQLQVEHALDLRGRTRVLFVDAAMAAGVDDVAQAAAGTAGAGAQPFTLTLLSPQRDDSFSTHAVSPQSLLQVYQDIEQCAPPPCWQLAIHGHAWELGTPPSAAAQHNLAAALAWAVPWLSAGPG